MTKSKSNALDALRALIAERQQYDQWISTLESKRDGTPEHVFNRVHSDYRSRRDRVAEDIKGHSEDLQLSITTLSSRLGEVAKEEEARRDTLQEAELRAAVGEYDEGQWESLRAEANRELDKIAGDRASLEGQLGELESIRKLSEVTDPGSQASMPAAAPTVVPVAVNAAVPATAQLEPAKAEAISSTPLRPPAPSAPAAPEKRRFEPPVEQSNVERPAPGEAGWPTRDIIDPPKAAPAPPAPMSSAPMSSAPASSAPAPRPYSAPPEPPPAIFDPAAAVPRPSAFPPAPPPSPAPPSRKKRDTPSGKDAQISTGFSKPIATPSDSRPEVNKTLKCPNCGVPNYPTEWYCDQCGGELATM